MAARRSIRGPVAGRLASLLAACPRVEIGRLALGTALVAAAVTTATTARAEMSLRWDSPANCPQRGDVLERIKKLTGSSLEETDTLSVEGRIEPAGARYSLTLLVRDGREVRKRVITSDSCTDLAGAAAVTLALLLGIEVTNPDALNPGDQSGTSSDNGTTPETDKKNGDAAPDAKKPPDTKQNPPPKVTPPVEPPDASDSGRLAFLLRAPFGSVDLGPLPHPSLGLGVGVGVRHESWRFLLSGRLSREQTVNAPAPNETSGADLSRFTAEVSACRGFRSHAIEIAPCLSASLEYVSARGFGVGVAPQSAKRAWPAAGAGAVAYWYPWESLAFFASGTGYVELARPSIVIEGLGEVSKLAPAAAGAVIGAEWIF